MNIIYSQPFREDKNIGAYYNDIMSRLKPGEYACFTDGDACFTTNNYGKQIADIIRKNPEAGLFTCMTNRIGNKIQLHEGGKSEDFNMLNHRVIGKRLQENLYSETIELNNPKELLSGVMLLVPEWNKIKFSDGALGVDNNFHAKCLDAGYPVLLLQGLYLFHYYRGFGEGKKHLLPDMV